MSEHDEASRVQIVKHVTRDRLIEFSDMLSVDRERSHIAMTMVSFNERFESTGRVRCYLKAGDIKMVCHQLLHGRFGEWTHQTYTSTENVSVFTIRNDPKYRAPFVIKIDNGIGEVMPDRSIKMVQTQETLTILLSEWDMLKVAQTLLDYIRDWEIVHFRKRQDAQTVILSVGGPQNGTI